MRLCQLVLIVPISVNVPELLRVCLKILRVYNVSIIHVLVVSDDSLYDALVACKIRESRVHTHAGPTKEDKRITLLEVGCDPLDHELVYSGAAHSNYNLNS
jgi:hypothetical protein